MADGTAASPPHTAPDGRPHLNDIDPLASAIYSMAQGRAGPHSVDLKIRDRDFLLSIEVNKHHIHILHLHNVRKDTLSEAKAAIDAFLNQIKLLSGDDQPTSTVFKTFDKVQREMSHHLGGIISRVDNISSELSEIDDNPIKYAKRTEFIISDRFDFALVQGFNPVAEMKDLCREFVQRAQEIRLKADDCLNESCPNRRGYLLSNSDDLLVYENILRYIGMQVQARGLYFDWYADSYSSSTMRLLSRQAVCHVSFDEEKESWIYQTGEETVKLWYLNEEIT